jgi:hypothetical protein
MLGNSWVAAQFAASEGGLGSMESANYLCTTHSTQYEYVDIAVNHLHTERFLTEVYCTCNCWCSGLCPLSSILKEHVSETASFHPHMKRGKASSGAQTQRLRSVLSNKPNSINRPTLSLGDEKRSSLWNAVFFWTTEWCIRSRSSVIPLTCSWFIHAEKKVKLSMSLIN